MEGPLGTRGGTDGTGRVTARDKKGAETAGAEAWLAILLEYEEWIIWEGMGIKHWWSPFDWLSHLRAFL